MDAKISRQCGDCQLCCRLLPVPPLNKKGGQRCEHQKFGTGCAVYNSPAMPSACRVWYCRWIVNDEVTMPRPDRAHYVIDMLPDEMALTNDEGQRVVYAAIQIWVDPAYWVRVMNDKALFKWIEHKADKHGTPAMLRRKPGHAVGVIAPSISPTGKWVITEGTINPDMGLWK